MDFFKNGCTFWAWTVRSLPHAEELRRRIALAEEQSLVEEQRLRMEEKETQDMGTWGGRGEEVGWLVF